MVRLASGYHSSVKIREGCSDVPVHGKVTKENDHMLYIFKRLEQRVWDFFTTKKWYLTKIQI